jgi:hypothetical protein
VKIKDFITFNFITLLLICPKHINPKKEKEQRPTAFWLEVSQRQAEILSLGEEGRVELN